LIVMARQNGVEPVLITHPALFGEAVDDVTQADLSRISVEIYRKMNGRMAWRLLEKYNTVTRKVGHKYQAGVIDLAARLPKSSRHFYDYLHYGKEGAAKVADIVAGVAPHARGQVARTRIRKLRLRFLGCERRQLETGSAYCPSWTGGVDARSSKYREAS
jgi:hypothetical protein